jgi:hypothetical protein
VQWSLEGIARGRVFVSRWLRVLLLVVVALGLLAPSAAAAPDKKLADHLGALWTTVLETPTAENPFPAGTPAFSSIALSLRSRRWAPSP